MGKKHALRSTVRLSAFLLTSCLMVYPHAMAGADTEPAVVPGKDKDTRALGETHLATLVAQSWAADWKEAKLADIRQVKVKNQPEDGRPIWHARIAGPEGRGGYLAWDAADAGELLEFALDGPLKALKEPDGGRVEGVPPVQQFAVPDGKGGRIASGCVPTAGASVVAFWIGHGCPGLKGDAPDGEGLLPHLTRRLRERMVMIPVPDKDGFTDDGMTLAGSSDFLLKTAMEKDAEARGTKLLIERRSGFSLEIMKSEIQAGRPVLICGTFRLPHKPELVWGHEIAGVAWATVGGKTFVGVLDNFYPTRDAGTIRWVDPRDCQGLMSVRPEGK